MNQSSRVRKLDCECDHNCFSSFVDLLIDLLIDLLSPVIIAGMADDARLGPASQKVWTNNKKGLSSPCGAGPHEWKQWGEYVKHCKKFYCEREGCGYFKKCWTKCEDINCPGCHVPAHKRF